MPPLEKLKLYLLLLLALIHVLISFFTIIPGYLVIDEVVHHLMVKSFSETGELDIWNGYEEYPSPELVPVHTVPHNGKLFPQYPYLFAVLGTPFYRIAGFHGLFFINVISFIGIVVLCYAVAQKLLHDRNLALNACFILILATFSWEYSQSAWTQTVATLFLMTAFYLYVCSFYAERTRLKLILALTAGIVVGAAMGLRLDTVLILPCFMLPLLFFKPWRPRIIFMVCLGTLPGISVLSITNYLKFDTLRVLSYGNSFAGVSEHLPKVKHFLPFAGLAAVILLASWGFMRYLAAAKAHRYKRRLLIGGLILLVLLVIIPRKSHVIRRWFHGTYELLIDFRINDLSLQGPALSRTQGGGMVYIGGLKKSLLQSCPYLVVLLLPLLKIFRREKERVPLFLLFLIPGVFVWFYGYYDLGIQGGLGLNLRYLVPILPFTSILAAYALRELSAEREWHYDRFSAIVLSVSILIGGIYFLYISRVLVVPDQQEIIYLTIPLILAVAISMLLLLKRFRVAVSIVVIVALIWSALVAFFYDYPLVRRARQYNLNVARQASQVMLDDAILFTPFIDPFSGVINDRQIRIANPERDNFYDFSKLITFHLEAGRPVYAAFHPWQWGEIRRKGLLALYKITPLEFFMFYQHRSILCRITARTNETGNGKS